MKRTIFFTLFTLSFTCTSAAIAQNIVNPVDPTDPNYVEQYTPKDNINRTYIYPDNSQNIPEKFNANKLKIEQRKLNPGLQLKSVKLLKYSEYIEAIKNLNGGILENMQMHPNRQVFLLEIDAPNGVELPNRGNYRKIADSINGAKQGNERTKLKKAKLFYVFDAETGDFINSDINEISE